MAGEVIKNFVFHGMERHWRGLLPCTPAELAAGLVPGVVLAQAVSVFAGIPAGLFVTGVLVAWRHRDHDRSDYFWVFLRRRLQPRRSYSASELDARFEHFVHFEEVSR